MAGFMNIWPGSIEHPPLRVIPAPALRAFADEHEVDEVILETLMGDSPLLQEDRKPWVIQGRVAGFRWDFPSALHRLIPQVENGLRKMLNDHGARSVTPEGIEEVWSYERILGREMTTRVVGAPLICEPQSLLVARLGANFRNLVAQGFYLRRRCAVRPRSTCGGSCCA